MLFSCCPCFSGGASKERETAGSLAALGMTSQKSEGKDKSKSRFPSGMTSKKGKDKNNNKGSFATG
ncbi:hypothetical protein [Granulicella mallensis]|uniref:Uncharacterized protein n=1 Tax=Granulicella mallensis (strain ATCC BAA-1857 / DSM 23137 / MP5ACTX8) TaxID=682795 RepID=G8NXT7_GRAMM|nr:hypothetical protein [Granulicella mallensis]AEU34432.1 hypothetical protein AciX8_0074 [Granulicella mallensis MP5ACTX8]